MLNRKGNSRKIQSRKGKSKKIQRKSIKAKSIKTKSIKAKSKKTKSKKGKNRKGKEEEGRGECSICSLPNDEVTSVTLNCFHTHRFHIECLKRWIDQLIQENRADRIGCPICRQPISEYILEPIMQNILEENNQQVLDQSFNEEEFDEYGSHGVNPYL
jgi:hypothetical protein